MMNMGLFHFQVMYEVLHNIHFIYDENELEKFIVSKLSEAFNAEGGTLFRLESDNILYPVASHGASIEELRSNKFEVGKGVVGWVVKYMQPVKVENPDNDPRFYENIDLTTGFKTRSIIAAPITSKNKPMGALEFLNRRDRPFVIQDLELISMIGRQIGIALENIKLIKELERKRVFQDAVSMSLSAGLITIDKEGFLLNINPHASKILNTGKVSLDEKNHVTNVFSGCPDFINVINQILSSDKSLNRQKVNIIIEDKEKVIGYSSVPVLTKERSRLGSAILLQDITQIS